MYFALSKCKDSYLVTRVTYLNCSDSFTLLYQRYKKKLCIFCVLLGINADDFYDIFHNLFLNFYTTRFFSVKITFSSPSEPKFDLFFYFKKVFFSKVYSFKRTQYLWRQK